MPQWKIVSTVSLNRDKAMSAEDATWENEHRLKTGRSPPTVNGTVSTDCKPDGISLEEASVEGWIGWVFGLGFV
jgi:hypothetical protein